MTDLQKVHGQYIVWKKGMHGFQSFLKQNEDLLIPFSTNLGLEIIFEKVILEEYKD